MHLLPAPPPERITSLGGRRLSVSAQVDGAHVSNRGVVLAWARTRAQKWACLFAWQGICREGGGRPRVSARWSWCVIGRVETFVHEPVRPGNPWGLAWYGPRSEVLEAAIAEAVATLPAAMRATAVEPLPRGGQLRLSSVNPRIEWSSLRR